MGRFAPVVLLQRLSCDMTANVNTKEIDLDKTLTPAIETRYARRLSVITGRPYPLPAASRSDSSGSLPDVSGQRSADAPGLVTLQEEGEDWRDGRTCSDQRGRRTLRQRRPQMDMGWVCGLPMCWGGADWVLILIYSGVCRVGSHFHAEN